MLVPAVRASKNLKMYHTAYLELDLFIKVSFITKEKKDAERKGDPLFTKQFMIQFMQ